MLKAQDLKDTYIHASFANVSTNIMDLGPSLSVRRVVVLF